MIVMGEVRLMRRRLKLFLGDEENSTDLNQNQVAMELSEFTRILSDAIIWDRTWLQDLGDEEVRISSDLYEVLTAYSQLRPSA